MDEKTYHNKKTTMKNKTKLMIALFLIAVFFSCNGQQKSENEDTKFDFEQIYTYGLQGDMTRVFKLLDSVPDEKLTSEQINLKEKFYIRFRKQDEKYNYKTTDTLAVAVLKLFQSYWRTVVLDNKAIEKENTELKNKFGDLLVANKTVSNEIPRDALNENIRGYLTDLLTQKGFYSNAMDKTQNLYELFLWAKQTEKTYDIKLPESDINVKVVFMEDFISKGWFHYVTFGKTYAGGWATKDALYCLKEDYDISSETFKVSYLKHEAQHFADYKSFPLLKQTDLEYRAKLTELSYAKEIIYDLISVFIRRSDKNKELAHQFAQYCLIRNLSKKIFNEAFVSDMDRWRKVSHQEINIAAVELIKLHTLELKNVGAESVTKFIE